MEQTRNFLPVVSTACSNCKHCRIVSVDACFCVFECKCVGTKNPVNGHVTYKDCKNARTLINGDWNIDCMWYEQRLSALQKVKRFFKRLSKTTDPFLEEPTSEDFEREYDNYFKEHETDIVLNPYTNCKDIACRFAKWGRNHFKNNSEMVNEDLEKATSEYVKEDFHERSRADFKAGAEWQKQQMMKNVVLETKVMKDCDGDGIETPYAEWLTLENTEIPYIPDNLGLKEGDKVKIIIMKEEQQ